MKLSISYTLTVEDYQEYLAAHQTVAKTFGPPKEKPSGWSNTWMWAGILMGVVLAFVAYDFLKAPPKPMPVLPPPRFHVKDFLTNLAPWVLIFLVVWGYLLYRLRHPSRQSTQKIFDADPNASQPHAAVVTEEAIMISTVVSSTTNSWAAFQHFAESEHLFVLYLTYNAAVFLPKRAFASPEDLNAFRTLAQGKIGAHTGAFPVLMPPAGGSSDQS